MNDKNNTVIFRLNRGFSLIELLIVVAIIGFLAAVAVPSYKTAIDKSRRADAYQAILDCAATQTRRYTTTSPPSYMDQAGAHGANLCGAIDAGDGSTDLESPDGYYSLTINNIDCAVNGRFWCFSITATAIGTQATDSNCLTMTVDHTGRKTATPDPNGDCWRS